METQVWRSRVVENNRRPSRWQKWAETAGCVLIGFMLGAAYALAF